MKFVIFTDKSYNYIKPIGDGLVKVLKEEGHECNVYYDGIYWLERLNLLKILFADIYRLYLNIKARKVDRYIYRFWSLFTFMDTKKKEQLRDCDCVIIVLNCPTAFFVNNGKSRIEKLRKKYKKPIVNYDLHYLPNQGWYKKIKEQNRDNFGLERYDWYLPVSLVTEYALPRKIPKIYSNIGFDIRSKNLYPDQKEFIALIDFERIGYETERNIQIQALRETNTPYIELKGKYTTDEIRNIYRRCSMFFLAFRESFGLPIVELQLCGCAIFTPYKNWAPAHFVNKDIYEYGDGDLGENFYVYDNDLEKLKSQIQNLKKMHNSTIIIDNLKKDYPAYYSSNSEELDEFFEKIKKGEINKDSHLLYKKYNDYISLEDDVFLVE